MSAFRQIKTEINDRSTLVGALKSMGYSPCVGTNQVVRGDRQERATGFDILLKKEATKLKADIGFRRETDGTYTLGMDSYVIREFTPAQFMGRVNEAYHVQKARKTAEGLGLEFVSREEVVRDGRKVIRLQYQKMGA